MLKHASTNVNGSASNQLRNNNNGSSSGSGSGSGSSTVGVNGNGSGSGSSNSNGSGNAPATMTCASTSNGVGGGLVVGVGVTTPSVVVSATHTPSAISPTLVSSPVATVSTTTTTKPPRNTHKRSQQPLDVSTLSSTSTSLMQTSTTTSNSVASGITGNGCGGGSGIVASNNTSLLNGSTYVPNTLVTQAATLLHLPVIDPSITSPPLPPPTTLMNQLASRTVTAITSVTPLTPLTPNGNVANDNHNNNNATNNNNNSSSNNNSNQHTYTNQHVLATAAAAATTAPIVSTASINGATSQSLNHSINNNHSNNINHNMSNNNFNHSNMNTSNCLNNQLPTTINYNNPNNNLNSTNYTNCNNLTRLSHNQSRHGPGPREALTSLGLLCLLSLLLAILSLIFLLKISPKCREDINNGRNTATGGVNTEDLAVVYDVTLALTSLALALNLCCLLVCAIQFLFAVKLVRSPMFDGRNNKYLEKSSASRTCAIGGFFISIPIFMTSIILYTFNHFHSTPAIITSVLIGVSIVFCGCAMVHNVFIWQKEKTISYRKPRLDISMMSGQQLPIVSSPTSFSNTLPGYIQAGQAHNLSFIQQQQQQQQQHQQQHQFQQQLQQQQFQQQQQMQLLQQQQQQQQQLQQQSHPCHINVNPLSVTPVSPNHSHGSFNPLICPVTGGGIGLFNTSFLMRPSTATPPTPRLPNGSCILGGREACGSVSPGIPQALDMSNLTSISLHELSTLV